MLEHLNSPTPDWDWTRRRLKFHVESGVEQLQEAISGQPLDQDEQHNAPSSDHHPP